MRVKKIYLRKFSKEKQNSITFFSQEYKEHLLG